MCASTNTRQEVLDRRMAETGIGAYLDFWIGGTPEIVDKKDHKELIIARYNMRETDFVHGSALVGDGYTDMIIAKEWGIKGIFVVRPHNDGQKARKLGKADEIVQSLTELSEVLENLFKRA